MHRKQTRPRKPQRRIFETSLRDSPPRILVVTRQQQAVPLYAEKLFGIQRCSLCEAGRSPESNAFLTDIMNTDRKRTLHPPTPSYKYSFRLNEEQNIRFNELLCKTGLEHNRSRFIVKRIFGEEFVVIKRDPSKTQFVARLNDFYFQFQKLANNCAPVKAI